MSITNGYNDTVVLSALETRLGWKQPTEENYAVLNDDNQVTDSGQYFNSAAFHASLTVKNIIDCQPDEQIGGNPDLINDYLTDLRKDNVISALKTVFSAESKPQFIESGLLFEQIPHQATMLETNGTSFVGVRFRLADDNYSYMLNSVSFMFNGAKTFTLYLYNQYAGKVKEWIVAYPTANTQYIKTLNEIITYNSSTVKGGEWYLGYYQEDLGSVQAVSYVGCTEEYLTFDAMAFKSNATGTTSFNMVSYGETNSNYGMNVEVSAYRDFTQRIIANAHLFDNLLGLMMVDKVMDIILNSPRLNSTKAITEPQLNALVKQKYGFQMGENGHFVQGIIHKIAKEATQVRNAFYGKSKNTVISCYS